MQKIRSLLYIILFLAAAWLSGCSAPKLTDALATDQENIQRIKAMNLLEHSVVLAPIESLIARQKVTNEETEQLVEIDTKELSAKLVETFRANNVFKKMEKMAPKDNRAQPVGDGLVQPPAGAGHGSQKALIKEARAKKATLLMRVTLEKARVYSLGNNDSALGNTAMWLTLGIPSLWGADINYGVEITARVSFLDVASSPDFATVLHSFEYVFKEEGGLSYLERSGSLAVLAIPPQYCPDDLDKVSETVLPLAQEQFLLKLAEQTKKELGPK
ncbi:MAG: hypothetical protein HZA49_05040 [Planctomycetes bacterium]|nr:hypothetical protein [Planctomycetota bacterium]